MTEAQLIKLLGRPLTAIEKTNLTLYLDIATEALEELICSPIAPVTETRTFDIREGYSTVFLDILRSVTEVKIDGDIIDSSSYELRQWDKRNATWYNSLVFDTKFKSYQKEITVTGEWGFETTPYSVPSGLQVLLAGLFAQISKVNKTDSTIESKQVEDFRVTFNADIDIDEDFMNKYRTLLNKYSVCNLGNLRHERKTYGCI